MHALMERLYQDHRNLDQLFDMLEDQVAHYRFESDTRPDLLLILDIVAYLNDYALSPPAGRESHRSDG